MSSPQHGQSEAAKPPPYERHNPEARLRLYQPSPTRPTNWTRIDWLNFASPVPGDEFLPPTRVCSPEDESASSAPTVRYSDARHQNVMNAVARQLEKVTVNGRDRSDNTDKVGDHDKADADIAQ